MESAHVLTLIGDDEERTPYELVAESAAATVIAIDLRLYEERGEWEAGDAVGWAHGMAVVTHGGRAMCHLTFELGEDDAIVAQGVLDLDGSSIGHGRIAVTGGTGRFERAQGTVRVQSRNPKRFRIAM